MHTPSLSAVRYWFLGALVATAPMSLHPSVSLPILNFPTFRIGLYQLLAVCFVMLCLPLVWRAKLLHSSWVLSGSLIALLITFVVGYSTSLVPDRTLLYSAAFGSLVVLAICAYHAYFELNSKERQSLIYVVLWSGIVFGSLALLQLIVATFDSLALGTLCAGCSSQVFGFPRINLFAAEPQFFASSLLPAFFASLFFIKNRWLSTWSLFLTTLAISLTFSRGAFAAIIGALIIFMTISLARRHNATVIAVAKRLSIAVVAVIIGFGFLVGSATIRYHGTPHIAFNTTVSMLEHLTMGVISIPQRVEPVPNTVAEVSPTNNNSFTPEGLVEASSNDRLGAAQLALNAWNDTPKTTFFGVGMGNLGAYVRANIDTAAPADLTVYIFYILVLSELGLVGLGFVLFWLGCAIWYSWRIASPAHRGLAITVVSAFAIQFLFFGSYINVMYIYVWLGICFALEKNSAIINKTSHA